MAKGGGHTGGPVVETPANPSCATPQTVQHLGPGPFCQVPRPGLSMAPRRSLRPAFAGCPLNTQGPGGILKVQIKSRSPPLLHPNLPKPCSWCLGPLLSCQVVSGAEEGFLAFLGPDSCCTGALSPAAASMEVGAGEATPALQGLTA